MQLNFLDWHLVIWPICDAWTRNRGFITSYTRRRGTRQHNSHPVRGPAVPTPRARARRTAPFPRIPWRWKWTMRAMAYRQVAQAPRLTAARPGGGLLEFHNPPDNVQRRPTLLPTRPSGPALRPSRTVRPPPRPLLWLSRDHVPSSRRPRTGSTMPTCPASLQVGRPARGGLWHQRLALGHDPQDTATHWRRTHAV